MPYLENGSAPARGGPVAAAQRILVRQDASAGRKAPVAGIVRWVVVAGDALVIAASLVWMTLTDGNHPPTAQEEEKKMGPEDEKEGEVFLTDEEFLESLKHPSAQRVTFEDEDKDDGR